MKKIICALAATMMFFVLASCKSAKLTRNNVDVSPKEVSVFEWKNQTLGEKSSPDWLLPLMRGNADEFKKQFRIDATRIVKYSVGENKTQAQAQAVSRTDFFARLAFELKQKIIARIGTGMNSYGELESIYDVASEARVDIAGVREEDSFWQRIRKTAEDGKTSDSYTYWIIYSMDKSTWDNIVANYINQIIGKADIESATQQRLRDMISEIQNEADREDAKRNLEEERAYQLFMQKTNRTAKADAELNSYTSARNSLH